MWAGGKSHIGESLIVKVQNREPQNGHDTGLVRLIPIHGGIVRHEEALCKRQKDDG